MHKIVQHAKFQRNAQRGDEGGHNQAGNGGEKDEIRTGEPLAEGHAR